MDIQRFAAFVEHTLEELDISAEELGRRIGLTGATISGWKNGKVDPGGMKLENMAKLAQIRGWSLGDAIAYLEGKTEKPDIEEQIEDLAWQLPLERVASINLNFSKVVYTRLAKQYDPLVSFEGAAMSGVSSILRNFLARSHMTVAQFSQIVGIRPTSRLQAIVDGSQSPTENDLFALATCKQFTKANGARYTSEELFAAAGMPLPVTDDQQKEASSEDASNNNHLTNGVN